ncbi:MAG: hypothetical protein J7L82_02365 [Staphylothermus sp.]|nr:hypothetical protein [Staphylothermus sp.]
MSLTYTLDLIQDVLVITIFILFIPLMLILMYRLVKSGNAEIEKIKKEYEARLKAKDGRIKELEEYIDVLKKKHREEMQMCMRSSKAAVEVYNALRNGAVKLRCPKHPDAEVEVLADGTITCSKGHRLWPREK